MSSAIIADDSRTIRLALKKMLEKHSFTIVGEAANGKEAIEEIQKHKADLLLLDINMPILTGLEALDPILDASPETVVIIMSSVSEKDTVEKCLDLGAANYIVKEGDWDDVEKTVLETWELNRID